MKQEREPKRTEKNLHIPPRYCKIILHRIPVEESSIESRICHGSLTLGSAAPDQPSTGLVFMFRLFTTGKTWLCFFTEVQNGELRLPLNLILVDHALRYKLIIFPLRRIWRLVSKPLRNI